MDTFKTIYTLIGGLGIFFYGMTTMSGTLQTMANDLIKKIISSLTSNRFVAVFMGVLITMLIQSSSVTTVMVVGLVNAGLMTLSQAVGVILGANVGTTITGWIISIKVGKYGLLLIGLGIFPALFAKTEKWKNIGKVVFGIGMIFLGLETMSAAFKPLRSSAEFLEFVSYFSGDDRLSYFASIGMGCLLTMVIQSSSAMLGITMTLASTGIIGFNTAVALVLGENIGTTITALLASVGGNVSAKRTARAHALFNISGVLIIFSILPYYIEFVDWLIPGDANLMNSDGERVNVAVHIASSHSIFNVTSTLIFIPFINYLTKLVVWLTPEKKSEKKSSKLIHLGSSSDILPATALTMAHEEIKKLRDIVEKMFKLSREYLKSGEYSTKTLNKIRDYEIVADNIQKEITVFTCQMIERPLSAQQSQEAQFMVRVADELESISDYLERLCTYRLNFKNEFKPKGEVKEEFFDLIEQVWKYYRKITADLETLAEHDSVNGFKKSEEIKSQVDEVHKSYIDRIKQGKLGALSALTYSEMVTSLGKIRGHVLNLSNEMDKLKVNVG